MTKAIDPFLNPFMQHGRKKKQKQILFLLTFFVSAHIFLMAVPSLNSIMLLMQESLQ